ncbi:MAG TPA: hypothetical protein VMG35_19370 [Bryobacteraceae bacterium]|nr:hypothetical protein [Bryobacteraceae bacterium]
MKTDQINVSPPAVIGNFKKIDNTEESRFTRQLRSNVGETDRLDRIDLDLAFLHAIPPANSDMRARPNADTASDLSTANAVSQPLRERHDESLHLASIFAETRL